MQKVILVLWLLVSVILLSMVSTKVWGGKPEKIEADQTMTFQPDMTVETFGQVNHLANPTLKKIFGLESKQDLQKKVLSFGLTQEQLTKKVNQAMALQSEHESKNWKKIALKFSLWIIWLVTVFGLLKKGRITKSNRSWLLLIAVAVFGVLLGSDPSPMGTVKDAIVLFASKGVIFPPRLIAFAVLLLMVFLANKLICAWGCQLGTLQDVLFRIMHERKTSSGVLKRRKIPFVVSNAVRIVFFVGFTGVALLWGLDIVETIDPFKVFKPQALGILGGVFAGVIVLLSLVVYRPWCHLFCPFGLVGWIVERFSVFRIRINRDTCIDCRACAKTCPTTVMTHILDREKTVPDCFSCGACIEVCPTDSIRFGRCKRSQDKPT
ncbi:MAG: 4Fe-4S binding protein [Phycisphaerae bacterium]|nr:4Fe-4S binding protein [Phycisphaerae bacterium]